MSNIIYTAAVLVTGIVVMAFVSRHGRHIMALANLALVLVLLYTAVGVPKPSWSLLGTSRQGEVIAAWAPSETTHFLYVWLLPPGATTPVAITIPWDPKAQREIEQERRDAPNGRAYLDLTDGGVHVKPFTAPPAKD